MKLSGPAAEQPKMEASPTDFHCTRRFFGCLAAGANWGTPFGVTQKFYNPKKYGDNFILCEKLPQAPHSYVAYLNSLQIAITAANTRFMSEFIKELLIFVGLAMPALIVITNPIAAASFFMPFTEGMERKEMKRVARKACLTSWWVMTVFAIFGTLIFKIFGITIYAFQIAGGIILFGVGMDMRKNIKKDTSVSQSNEDFAVVPLAIPMIAGPGAITTCLMLAGEAENLFYVGVLVACITVTLILMYFILIHSSKTATLLGEGGVRIMTRLMGLILAVIAVQFVINGIKGVLPTIAPILSKCIKG